MADDTKLMTGVTIEGQAKVNHSVKVLKIAYPCGILKLVERIERERETGFLLWL